PRSFIPNSTKFVAPASTLVVFNSDQSPLPFLSTSKTNSATLFPSFLTQAILLSQPANKKGSEYSPCSTCSFNQTAPDAVFEPNLSSFSGGINHKLELD